MEFLLGEAPTAALPEATFDVILANFVLHDVARDALPWVLVALGRSLRPEGRFVVVEPDTSSGSGSRIVPAHHRLPAGELRSQMAAAGLAEQSREIVSALGGSAVRSVFALA